jgi:hypothetical protein
MRCTRPFFLLFGLATLLLGGCKQEFRKIDSLPKAWVKLPDPVLKHVQAIPWTNKPNEEPLLPVTVYLHEDKNGTYLASAYSLPVRPGDVRTEEERLHEASKAIREHFQVPEPHWSVVPLPLRKMAGLEISYYIPDQKQHARTRLYLFEGILFNLTAVGTEKWVDSEDSRKFLDSFELRPTPEAGVK